MNHRMNNSIGKPLRLLAVIIFFTCATHAQAQNMPVVKCVSLAKDTGCRVPIYYGRLLYFNITDWTGLPTEKSQLLLYVNDIPLPYYQCAGVNRTANKIFFSTELRSDITNTDQKTIIDLIRSDFGNGSAKIENLRFGIGSRTGNVVANAPAVTFVFFDTTKAIVIALVAFMLFIVGFVFLGKKNALNESPNDDNKSLRKFQLLFWTLIITFCYFSLWLILMDAPLLPDTVIGLLGITIGTTVVSSMIPEGPKNVPPPSSPAAPRPFKGLLADSQDPLAVHKLQFWIFTIIFGIIFVYTALTELRIYNFSTQQLILMGISSAGYVGMKALRNT